MCVRELEVGDGVVGGEAGEGRGGGEEGSAVGAHIERRVLFVGGEAAETVLFVEDGVSGGFGSGSGSGLRSLRRVKER